MFTPAEEFDYREVIVAQLEAILLPLVDGRRGVHFSGREVISVDLGADCGRLVGKFSISYEVD